MKTKIISLLIFTMLIATAKAMSMTMASPLRAEGEILFFNDLSTVWVFVYSEDNFNKMTSKSKQKYLSKKDRILAINIFGIMKVEKLKSFNDTDNQQVALQEIESRIKGRSATLNCIGSTKKDGLPICEVIVGSVNLGMGMIENGISPFVQEGVINSQIRKIYLGAQESAKESQIGVWKPFYGLFKFEDLDEMEKERNK